jgi:hypothetical protein
LVGSCKQAISPTTGLLVKLRFFRQLPTRNALVERIAIDSPAEKNLDSGTVGRSGIEGWWMAKIISIGGKLTMSNTNAWTAKHLLIPAMILALVVGGGQIEGQDEKDPHRPACTSARCRKNLIFSENPLLQQIARRKRP